MISHSMSCINENKAEQEDSPLPEESKDHALIGQYLVKVAP